MRRLLCWLLGHKEKRVAYGTRIDNGCDPVEFNRICKRCGATRIARKRKSPTKGT